MDPNGDGRDFYAYEQITDMDDDPSFRANQTLSNIAPTSSTTNIQLNQTPTHVASSHSNLKKTSTGNVLEVDFESVKKHISELVLWKSPVKSGVVLGLLLFIEIVLMSMSFLSIVGYSGLFMLIFFFGYRVVLRVTGKEDKYEILKKLDTQLTLSQEECDKMARKFGKKLERLVNYLRELFLMKNIGDSLKFAGFLYFLTYIGASMNFLTLCLLATIFSFTLPKVYELKKDEIDKLFGMAKDHARQLSNKALEKFNEIKNSKLKAKPDTKAE